MAKNKSRLQNTHHSIISKVIILIMIFVLICVAFAVWKYRSNQLATYTIVSTKISEIENLQKENSINTVNTQKLNEDAARAKKQIEEFDLISSAKTLDSLKQETVLAQEEIDQAITTKNNEAAAQAALANRRATAISEANVSNNNVTGTLVLPIIMYHKPPADFDAQMTALKNKGYTTVHMADVANFFAGSGKLPTKPAVVTFDDGFEVQMSALPILQKNNQKGTLYLIVGGVMSHYCIGLLRSNVTCGDAYLSIPEVKQMMSSNLIEIGDHTIDHPNMASLSPADQTFQITASKTFLNQTFGVPITSFAYPYGNYNGTTVRILSQNGFNTAVTTQPGIVQSSTEPLLLHRTRSTYDLP